MSNQQEIALARAFHPFPRLPTEIRLEIWHMTFLQSRTVCLDLGLEKEHRPIMENNPIALQINRESRNETLRHYLDVLVHSNKIPQLQAHDLANSLSLGLDSADIRILRLAGKQGQYINHLRDWSYIQLTSFSCEGFHILCEGASDLMQQLERLEIRGHGVVFYNMVNMKTLGNSFYLQGQLNSLIPRFPALKELRLVVVCRHPLFTQVGDKMLALFADA